jgi:hypothetical protein
MDVRELSLEEFEQVAGGAVPEGARGGVPEGGGSG